MSKQSRPDLMPTNLDQAFGRLVEELHEVGVECGHILRFGFKAQDRRTGKVYDNGQALIMELDDLISAIIDYKNFYSHRWNGNEPIKHGQGSETIMCESCGVNAADSPSKFCPDCIAYMEHMK